MIGPQRHQEAEGEGEHARCRLGDIEEPSLVDPVHDQPAPAAEQQHRQELQGRDDADVEPVPVELVREDEQAQGDGVHPGARGRDHLAEEVEAVVADPQRLEGLSGRPGDRAHSVGHQVLEEAGQVLGERLFSRVQGGQSTGEKGVLESADPLEVAATIGGDPHPDHPPVDTVGLPGHQAGVLKRGHQSGHRRRLHLLGCGQLARRWD